MVRRRHVTHTVSHLFAPVTTLTFGPTQSCQRNPATPCTCVFDSLCPCYLQQAGDALWRFWIWAIFGPEKNRLPKLFSLNSYSPTPKLFRLVLLLPECSPNTTRKVTTSEPVQYEKRIGLYAYTILSFLHQSGIVNISPSVI